GRGEALSQGSTQVNLRFPGQYYDAESGLHYNYFRDYDPETGRYVESDPIGLSGGVNTYGYVQGAPLNRIDPLGLAAIEIDIPKSAYDWIPGNIRLPAEDC
ncbi:RHS repeat-associated core domain-containing protein, partial [Pseudomonas aeruginosa]